MNDYLKKENINKLPGLFKGGHVELYLIKRTTSRQPEFSREILKADIKEEVRAFFENALDNRIRLLNNPLADPDLVIKDFFAEDKMPEDISFINDINLIPTLPSIISQISQHSDLVSVKEFDEKTLEKLHSYAIKISLDEDNILIYFRRHSNGWIMSSKRSWIARYKGGTFDKLDGDIFRFDEEIDCIYYKYRNEYGMYILGEKGFEDIFSFIEVYKDESRKAYEILKASPHIIIRDGLFDEIQEKKTYIKRIAFLNKRDEFKNLNHENLIKMRNMCTSLSFDVVGDKIHINDKASLKAFLDVCEKNILQDPLQTSELYRTRNKQKV
jgi:hypothetical protein